MMMMEYYFKDATHPIRLGETRRPDKVMDVTGSLQDAFETVKHDPDFDNLLYARLVNIADIHPKDHGFDIYFKDFSFLLDFIEQDFIKKSVLNNARDVLSDKPEYLLKISPHGYIYAVHICAENGVLRPPLYIDSGN